MTQKIESLLSALRAAQGPEREAGPAAPAPDYNQAVAQLREQIEQLERRLEEMSSPAVSPEEEPAKPPAPPTELALFLQTRMELLESKLELAQQEALRANLLLRERETAQRKAQHEVEEMFRSIREQQRAASYDGALRAQYLAGQQRIRELEARLGLAQLAMVPAEEVLACLEREEGQAELKRRLLVQVEECRKRAAQGASSPGAEQAKTVNAPLSACTAAVESEEPALAVVLARVADLERRLEQAQQDKDRERQARLQWENSMLVSLRQTRGQWRGSGGPELLVEATLEGMVDLLHRRDEAQRDMSRLLDALRDEPPASAQAPALRARLEERRRSMEEIQRKLDQQMAVVQAWVARNKAA